MKVKGEVYLPGDKSISHRAVILSSISTGTTEIEDFLFCEDCLSTINAFQEMGIKIELSEKKKKVVVYGKGLKGLSKPNKPLYLGNSGTSMRLLSGLLSGQSFSARLEGDASLSKRPMARITVPLRLMGAQIKGRKKEEEEYPPLVISRRKGNKPLQGIEYRIPVASAQVKSALLLAGLYARGKTEITEIAKTRDHTERMLKLFKANLSVKGLKCLIYPSILSSPKRIKIPGDISSAAFFLVAALLLPNSSLVIKNVGLNPTRTGIIDALKKMGAEIRVKKREGKGEGEPIGEIKVETSRLKGIEIKGKIIPRLIDEIPILMVAACFAKGETRIKDIGELRIKEVDRIHSLCYNLKKMGAEIEEKEEEVIITGTKRLKGAALDSFKDHRTAMALTIAGLKAEGKTVIKDKECIKVSFPDFEERLKRIIE